MDLKNCKKMKYVSKTEEPLYQEQKTPVTGTPVTSRPIFFTLLNHGC